MPAQTFSELCMEITDGYELLGNCPYDFNIGYESIILCEKIEIPIHKEVICVNTIIGEFQFIAMPKHNFSKDLFMIGFSHSIRFRPSTPINIKEIRGMLTKITDFFSLLCGEIVTINRLSLVDNEDSMFEYIGYCNFPKEKLNIFGKKGIDSTRFKSGSLFKITDFSDLEKALNYWLKNYECLYNAQQAYGRILLDEEMKIVTVNKYLAAMQLIEGVSQAYTDEEQEILEFNIKKQEIMSKLDDESDKELIENGLQLSGITFRKAVINFFLEVLNSFEQITKSAFIKQNGDLLDKIVNDRNFYTHSSKRIKAELSFDETMNIAVLCKDFYRIFILKKAGIPESLLQYRLERDRVFAFVLDNLFGMQIKSDREVPKFDKEMSLFND